MNWEYDIKKRVVAFPADFMDAYEHSIHHREEIGASTQCGCFYCCETFPPDQIVEWTDHGETALCPMCGIDSVIGDRSGFPITKELLSLMKRRFF